MTNPKFNFFSKKKVQEIVFFIFGGNGAQEVFHLWVPIIRTLALYFFSFFKNSFSPFGRLP